MQTIFKYKLFPQRITTIIDAPKGAIPLSVLVQEGETPVIYLLVDSGETEIEQFFVYCFQTGETVPDNVLRNTKFIGTLAFYNGDYVLHVYA